MLGEGWGSVREIVDRVWVLGDGLGSGSLEKV